MIVSGRQNADRKRKTRGYNIIRKEEITMGCICELFENETLWLIILTLLILTLVCGNGSFCGTRTSCGGGCHC